MLDRAVTFACGAACLGGLVLVLGAPDPARAIIWGAFAAAMLVFGLRRP